MTGGNFNDGKAKRLTELIQAVVSQDRLDPAEALPPLRRVLVEDLSSTHIRNPTHRAALASSFSNHLSAQRDICVRPKNTCLWVLKKRCDFSRSSSFRVCAYLVGPVA